MAYRYTSKIVAGSITRKGTEAKIQATLDEMSAEGWEFVNSSFYDYHIILFFKKEM